MTTDKRQLRLTFAAILESYGIDNLAIESKLVDAAALFFDQTKKGIDPVRVRKDIIQGMLDYKDKYTKFEDFSERVARIIRVTPDGSDTWNAVIKFIVGKDDIGEHLETYAKWMSDDPYNSPKLHQIAQNPRLIISTWPAAFSSKSDGYNPQNIAVGV